MRQGKEWERKRRNCVQLDWAGVLVRAEAGFPVLVLYDRCVKSSRVWNVKIPGATDSNFHDLTYEKTRTICIDLSYTTSLW